jgi:XTP/dITP diphosphohydrolase
MRGRDSIISQVGRPSPRYLVLGTWNRKKGLELADLLVPLGFTLQILADFPDALRVVEDGDSFAANASKKATQQAGHLNRWVLGEDSGLMVDALDGAPGIFSARYAGTEATDQENNRRLVDALRDVPTSDRTARYVCHATLADPTGTIRAASEAACRGRIATAPAGTAGFGYDPLFEIVEYQRTFGQLGDRVKRLLSHRSRALRGLLPQITRLVRAGSWA